MTLWHSYSLTHTVFLSHSSELLWQIFWHCDFQINPPAFSFSRALYLLIILTKYFLDIPQVQNKFIISQTLSDAFVTSSTRNAFSMLCLENSYSSSKIYLKIYLLHKALMGDLVQIISCLCIPKHFNFLHINYIAFRYLVWLISSKAALLPV